MATVGEGSSNPFALGNGRAPLDSISADDVLIADRRDYDEEQLTFNEAQLPKLVNILKELIQGDKKLSRKSRHDYQFLVKFIRVRSYDVNRAFTLVQKYYNNIDYSFDMMHNVRPSTVAQFYHDRVISVLKKKDRNGCPVFVVCPGWDTKKFNVCDFQMASGFLAEEMLTRKNAQVNGISAIVDMKNVSFAHVKQVSVAEMRRIFGMAQGGFPAKISSVHVVNCSSIIWTLYYVAKRFIQSKIRERIHFHSNYKTLQQYFEPEMLPTSLEGKLEESDAFDLELVTKLLQNDRPYDDYFTDSSLGKSATIKEL